MSSFSRKTFPARITKSSKATQYSEIENDHVRGAPQRELGKSSLVVCTNKLIIDRSPIDAFLGRSDPVGHFTWLDDRLHEGFHEGFIFGGRKPPMLIFRKFDVINQVTFHVEMTVSKDSNSSVKANARKCNFKVIINLTKL